MIPNDKVTLPEKTAQRYVFLGRPRRVQTMRRGLLYPNAKMVHRLHSKLG